MKKYIYAISLAALAMISCNKEETLQANMGSKIEFRHAVETRATELQSLDEFYVVALYSETEETYFEDTYVKDTESTNYVAASGEEYYWPASARLMFVAYYPLADELSSQVGATVNISKEGQTVTGYTPQYNDKQIDFVTAVEVTTKDESPNGVELAFKHQLSQIAISGINENAGYVIKVKAVRIKNVAGSGDFDFTAAVSNWAPNFNNIVSYDVLSLADGSEITLGSSAQSLMDATNGSAMLIPQQRTAWGPEVTETPDGEDVPETVEEAEGDEPAGDDDATSGEENVETPETDPNGSYIAFYIQVNTKDGVRVFPTNDDWGWVAKPIAFNWLSGYKYNYACDFSDGVGVIAPDEDTPTGTSPYKPGDDVYGGKINVSVSFDGWPGSWNTIDASHE